MKRYLHFVHESNFVFNFINQTKEFAANSDHNFCTIHAFKNRTLQQQYEITLYTEKVVHELNSGQYTDLAIHFLTNELVEIILKFSKLNIKIHWFFWGADMYLPLSKFADRLLDEETLIYFNKNGTFASTGVQWKDALKRLKYKWLEPVQNRFSANNKRRQAIQRINYFWHYNIRDYDELKNTYNTKAEFREFFYRETDYAQLSILEENRSQLLKIQVGHSATITNNHFEALNLLKKFATNPISVDLSHVYGNQTLSKHLESIYATAFKTKLNFIRIRMRLEEYNKWLGSIDIALMNHRRTEAAGNIFVLLSMGKKVYMHPQSNLYKWLKEKNVVVYNILELNTVDFKEFSKPLTLHEKTKNHIFITDYFSDAHAKVIFQALD